MVIEEKFGKLNEEQKDILSEILNSENFMLEVVANALFLMRYENEKPKLKLEKIDVKDEINTCVEMIKNYAKEKSQKIIIKAKDNIKINADKILIQKIILNLLTGSINNGFENSDIEILVKENNKKVSFQAKNKSAYMTKEKITSLFQEKKELSDFNQLGMSLNLNIAKNSYKRITGKLLQNRKRITQRFLALLQKSNENILNKNPINLTVAEVNLLKLLINLHHHLFHHLHLYLFLLLHCRFYRVSLHL